MPKRNILIVHGYSIYPLRSSVRDLLYCYGRYMKNDRVFYLNLYQEFSIPEYIKKINFDLILFHTVFLSGKWMGRDFFQKHIIEKVLPFRDSKAIKAILPQDEWIHTKCLVDFVNTINIDHVFTVAPPSEWEKIYDGVDFEKVKFHEILTGYIDDKMVKKTDRLKNKYAERPVDISYRAFKSPPWLGKHGFLKTTIADIFNRFAPRAGFKTDISTNNSDTIIGDAWYDFMSRSKFFIGVEGGSTVIDPDGSIWQKGSKYINDHPGASFEEVEANCFPGLDGKLQLIAISPRHLEACQTGTCQVLIEGRYNNILRPMEHYIPLKKDFSDLENVFTLMKDERLRKQIVEKAYRDIVASGKYFYSSFVKQVIDACILSDKKKESVYSYERYADMYLFFNKIQDRIRWILYNYYTNVTIFFRIREYVKFNLLVRVKGRTKKIMSVFR